MYNKKPKKPNDRIKRILDIVICLLGLPLAVPVGIMLSLIIYLDSGCTPIYRHKRIGKNGATFTIYKFRTMVRNADALLKDYLKNNPDLADEWNKNQKLKDDPRLTRSGHFLRKYSLDELPQILNILRGEMSLVGPRPIVANEKVKYGRYFEEYCQVRPGLTGLWQTSGRNNTTYSQRVAYDHYYINNWTIWLDLWILAKTVPIAINGNGAY